MDKVALQSLSYGVNVKVCNFISTSHFKSVQYQTYVLSLNSTVNVIKKNNVEPIRIGMKNATLDERRSGRKSWKADKKVGNKINCDTSATT